VQEELAKVVCESNAKVAALLFNGRPLVLSEISKFTPAILEMWMPGCEGGNAAANLLFGEVNPSGKLSMSFPKSVGQCPISYTYYNTGRPKSKGDDIFEMFGSDYIDCGILPLYFFGQGLSYTNFVYESMTLDKNEIDENGELTVSVTVRNAGERDGREVVQLYMRDMVSSTARPMQELLAFEKVFIKAGESVTVEFKVNEPMLRYYNFDCEYVSEKGEFSLMVGYANHFALKDKFRLV
jgi:beta-glucosidase